jgi:Skp family chaperone for outer membrane proteins
MKAVYGFIVTGIMLAAAGAARAEEVKYAYVDVANVFDNYQKTKDNDRTLQDSGKKKEEERDALVHEIRQMKDELTLMAEDAKAKKQETLSAKMKELQDFDRDARQALGEQRNKVVREIFKDIDDTVQRIGERKAVDMVFNERALLYHNPKHDMTKEVIDELNKGYGKKK